MVLLVPFDDSALSRTALARAREYAEFADDSVLAVSVIPDDPAYAETRGWLDAADSFDVGVISRKLAQRAHDVAPNAEFRSEFVENDDPVASTTLDVVRTLREVAADVGATVIFVGSENAGRISAPLASVGAPVSNDPRYDVFMVRHADDEI